MDYENRTTTTKEMNYDKVGGDKYTDKELKESLIDGLVFSESRAYGFIRGAFYLAGELEVNQKGLNSVYSFRNIQVALKFAKAVELLTGATYEVAFSCPSDKRKSRKFVVEIPEKNTYKLLDSINVMTINSQTGKMEKFSNGFPKNLEGEFAEGFFLLTYLEAGKLTDYDDYKLEIQFDEVDQARDMFLFFARRSINTGLLEESKKLILRTTSISEFFAFCGASKVAINLSLYYINKSVNKEIARKENFKLANLDKTLTASAVQTVAINNIKKADKFGLLPAELKELAEARISNPDLSIQKLAELLGISKSTAYHRMERIIEFSKELN